MAIRDVARVLVVPLRMEQSGLETQDIKRFIEAMLFVADGPADMNSMARSLDVEIALVEQAVHALSEETSGRGLMIVRSGQRVQLATAPDTVDVIERFLGVSGSSKLSGAAMEALAIIAYRQPITRAQVDAVRGVNSDGVMRTLQARQLIQPMGRLEQAGRPVIYSTTFEFLEYFGISSLESLPPLPPSVDGADPQDRQSTVKES